MNALVLEWNNVVAEMVSAFQAIQEKVINPPWRIRKLTK